MNYKEPSILEALLNLNSSLMMNGFNSDFKISLENDDFEKFIYYFETTYKNLASYPELKTSIPKINQIKIAGPGSYFLVERILK